MSKIQICCFMYSQEQIKEQKEINAKIGRDFVSGEVSVGSKRKKITDIIPMDALAGYMQRFPDGVIVHKGERAKTVYKKPTTPYIGSGKE